MAKKYTYSDIEYRFTKDGAGDIRIITNEDSIKQSIKTILSTRLGERLMLPEFGSNVYTYVFEPIDVFTTQSLQRDIEEVIKRWEDRVYVSRVIVSPNYDENYYIISIEYVIINTGQQGEFVAALDANQ